LFVDEHKGKNTSNIAVVGGGEGGGGA